MQFGSQLNNPLIIFANFNVVFSAKERIGCHLAQYSINGFNSFFLDVGVLDVGYTDNMHIYYRKEHGIHVK